MKKHVIHKNQIIITSLAILIAVAGYLSYDEHASRTSAGETGSGVRLERSTEIVSLYDGTEMDSTEMNPGESVFTGASVRTGDYAATAKMNREQARSKAKEELKAILDRTDLSKEEKQSAADALVVLTENAKKEDDNGIYSVSWLYVALHGDLQKRLCAEAAYGHYNISRKEIY